MPVSGASQSCRRETPATAARARRPAGAGSKSLCLIAGEGRQGRSPRRFSSSFSVEFIVIGAQ